MKTIKQIIQILKDTITENNSTYEQYSIRIDFGWEGSWGILINFEEDDFEELQFYGVIPESEMIPIVKDAEDDYDTYRDIPVAEFLKECPWTPKSYEIEKQY